MLNRKLAAALLRLTGWTLIDPEPRPNKAVIIGYPHTSNWDGIVALLCKFALPLEAHWVGKASLFAWPFGGLLERLGGVPVDRSRTTGFVLQMNEEFARRERFLLVLAPEGTRRLTAGWKSGFYHIALAAGVPVGLGFVDYARREAGILGYLTLSGDMAADLAEIARRYAGRTGKNPEQASPVRWLG